jgi:hypothetical protein
MLLSRPGYAIPVGTITRTGRTLPEAIAISFRSPAKSEIKKVLLPVSAPLQTPFDSVENAQQYVRLLVEAIAEAKSEIAADLGAAAQARSERRVQALQIVQFKLDKLEHHLKTSNRLLNDLRTLRRLLLDERPEPITATSDQDSAE